VIKRRTLIGRSALVWLTSCRSEFNPMPAFALASALSPSPAPSPTPRALPVLPLAKGAKLIGLGHHAIQIGNFAGGPNIACSKNGVTASAVRKTL